MKIKISNVEITGLGTALRAMRNPMNSWDKCDGYIFTNEEQSIGSENMRVAKKCIKAGVSHRKFIRFMDVSADMVLTREIWQEMDTYKIGTVKESCSTMHKLCREELSFDKDFDFIIPNAKKYPELSKEYEQIQIQLVNLLNKTGDIYKTTKDFDLVRCAKKIHPEGRLLLATMKFSYEVLMNMYFQRRYHRLPEWREICRWIETLPFMKEWLPLANKRNY